MENNGPRPLRASIIITNYNYARFLPQAIDSALDQTYPHTEVIVVDDGSTDDSRRIIAAYGERVVAVFKENGGMGSAFNAGFAASRGDLVCFLDADDVFFPEKIAVLLAAWRSTPGASVLYHQLQGISAEGAPTGAPWPARVLRGDLADRVERSGGWWPCPVTTGLGFTRPFLERVLPLPAEDFRVCAEAYLTGLAPFLGTVVGVRQPLAFYRGHVDNYWRLQFAARQAGCRRKADQYAHEFRAVRRALHERLGRPTALSLDDHHLYQYYRRGAGEPISRQRVLAMLARCPVLPPAMKAREALNVLLNRL